MKRFVVLPCLLTVCAVIASAEGPETAEKNRLRQLEKNRDLIHVLVDGGLQLAAEPDALKRAAYCNSLAEKLAGEIKQASQHREGARTLELSQHFYDLLYRGVARNLTTIRKDMPAGSTQEPELRRVGKDATKVAQLVEQQLKLTDTSDPDHRQRVLKAMRTGRLELEAALQEAEKPPEK